MDGVIGRSKHANNVHQKVSRQIEEDEEEVETDDAEKSVDLGNGGLSLGLDDQGVL